MAGARKKYLLIAAVVYFAVLVAIVWGMFSFRTNVLRDLDSPESRERWQAWRADVEKQQRESQTPPRRVPKSEEPPTLVLMRDYFVTCLVGAVLFVSLLYWALAGMTIGALTDSSASDRAHPASRRPRS